jgi:hypothetical protein
MKLSDLLKQMDLTKLALEHAQKRIDEAILSLEFGSMLGEIGKFHTTDLDKLVYSSGKLIAGFELKVRSDAFRKFVLLNASQYLKLKDLAAKLEIPFYYIIWHKSIEKYRVLELRNWKEFDKLGKGHGKDSYVKIPLEDSVLLSRSELVRFLKGILGGDVFKQVWR